jgi:hypothetical protein
VRWTGSRGRFKRNRSGSEEQSGTQVGSASSKEQVV